MVRDATRREASFTDRVGDVLLQSLGCGVLCSVAVSLRPVVLIPSGLGIVGLVGLVDESERKSLDASLL